MHGEAGTKPSVELSLEMPFVARLPSLSGYAPCSCSHRSAGLRCEGSCPAGACLPNGSSVGSSVSVSKCQQLVVSAGEFTLEVSSSAVVTSGRREGTGRVEDEEF